VAILAIARNFDSLQRVQDGIHTPAECVAKKAWTGIISYSIHPPFATPVFSN
jgi:hypothetical protein